MEIAEVDVLQIDVGPSRYCFAQDGSARLLRWQISLADFSLRSIVSDQWNSRCQLNIRAMPVAGLGEFEIDDVKFVRYHGTDKCLIFGPKNPEWCRACVPKFSYRLMDLSIGIEIMLDNIGTFPLHWCPVIRVPLCLPWHDDLSIDQYSIRSKAKKKFTLNDDLTVIESAKCADKLPISFPNENLMAISGMQDYRMSIVTKNEEETLSVILCGKYPNAYFALRRTEMVNCIEFLCMPDLPGCDANSKEWLCYRCIQPGKADSFAIELSVR
ncbi:MAG: hypothetical protein LBB15_01205 [Puniceicoccales bacterium]|jgi:hypothetical protein|nr:hypothetical protein [Puniceicoccales bacterium]